MRKGDVLKQLCKMQSEIAGRLGLETICTCGDKAEMVGEVPDVVIEEMWRRLTDPLWSNEKGRRCLMCHRPTQHPFWSRGDTELCKRCGKLVLSQLSDEQINGVVARMKRV